MTEERHRRLLGIHQKIADNVAEMVPNFVECDRCGQKQAVDFAKCLRAGWPKCCGETMKLNSPQKDENES